MYDVTREELMAAVEAEEREWLSTDDIHPYKSRVPQTKGNTVSFPKITKFNTYLLNHYSAEIVEEINGLLYDGELAAICGVDGFHSQQLTHDRCRIDPRMTFWRVNKYEFTADLVVYLKANAYNDDYSGLQSFTLYVSLDFCIDDRMTYEFGGISLKQPERDRIKLDDYLIPVLGMREVNAAAEDLLFEYMPEALHDYKLLDPFKLARKMGLEVAYHKLYKNHKTKSVLYWFDSEVKVTPRNGDDKAPPIVVKIPAGTILINENAVHRDRSRLNVYHECFHDEYHWLFYRLQEMHNNDLRKIKRTRKPKNQGKEPKNPLTIMEWEAKQGSMALMMPESIMRPMIEQCKTEERKIHKHAGWVYQGVGYSIYDAMDIPKYLARSRMIQLGYWQAQGSLNYIQANRMCGRYITPFTFSRESCPTTAHRLPVHQRGLQPDGDCHVQQHDQRFSFQYPEKLLHGGQQGSDHLCAHYPRYI